MGLDSFKSSGTRSTGTSSSKASNASNNDEDSQEESDPYKVFNADDDRKKVFQTEEEWNDAVEFIENELGMTEEQVESMQPTQRHDVLHQAILGEEGQLSGDFYPTRQCIVCDDIFSFPTNWNFTKFEGEPVCKDHTVEEVVETYREMNELHG